jgi:putative phosphoesterase
MRLAIISDTHLPGGGRRLPQSCESRLASADLILHAGDLQSQAFLTELRELGPAVHAVYGNVDEPVLRRALPETLEISEDGVNIAMTHDAGPARHRLKRLRALFPQADLVVFGHSHIPLLEADRDGFQIFNPGSPTQRRRAPHHTMGIADVHAGRVSVQHVLL